MYCHKNTILKVKRNIHLKFADLRHAQSTIAYYVNAAFSISLHFIMQENDNIYYYVK